MARPSFGASTMQKMSSLWAGRSGYTESSFLDDEPPAREGSLGAVPIPSPKQPEAVKPRKETQSETWNQAATIRAQLEEELKREGVSRGSPTQQNVRPRTQSMESQGSSGTLPKSPVLDSADPLACDRTRKRTNTDKFKKKEREKKGSPDSVWATANDGFGEVGGLDSPRGLKSDNPWTTSPVVESAKPVSDIWDFGSTNNFSWPQQKSVSVTAPSPVVPSSAKIAAASLADGFASPSTLPWGGEDSPGNSPERLEAEKIYAPPSSVEASEAPLEPLTGPFDEAILAALVALPQQALVGILRRLGTRRPTEVELALGVSQSNAVPLVASPPKTWQGNSVASVNGVSETVEVVAAQDRGNSLVHDAPVEQQSPREAPAPVVLAPTSEAIAVGTTSVTDPATNALEASSSILEPGLRVRCVGLVSSPELNGTFCSLLSFNADTGRWTAELEKDKSLRNFKADNLEPAGITNTKASAWPPGPPTGSSGSNVFEAIAPSGSNVFETSSPWPAPSTFDAPSGGTQQVSDLWPPPPDGVTQSSPAVSPWETSGQSSPWPPTASSGSPWP